MWPLTGIRMLGGKLGAQIAEALNYSTVGELLSVSRESMNSILGTSGDWVYDYVRGIDLSPVLARTENQSMKWVGVLTSSTKNFTPGITDSVAAKYWMKIMASELSVRLSDERSETANMYPRTLVLRYVIENASPRSCQAPFGNIPNAKLQETIFSIAERLWDESAGPKLAGGSVSVVVVSLGFAGIERRGERSLESFYTRRKREDSPQSGEKRSRIQSTSKKLVYQPDVPQLEPTELEWRCPECGKCLQVPVFDDPADGDERSDETLLYRLRTEHQDWHMALALS